MKKQLLKKLAAFITLMFSIFYLHAQCPGNKVQMCKTNHSGFCRYICVAKSQVSKYEGQGWGFFCFCNYGFAKHKIKTPVKWQVINTVADAQKGEIKNSLVGYFCKCGLHGYGCNGNHNCINFCVTWCGGFITKKLKNTDGTSAIKIPSYSISKTCLINFYLEKSDNVSMKVFDETGKLIKILADTKMEQGIQQIEWNTKDERGNIITPGTYLLQLESNKHSETINISLTT